jgi:PAS domain S-box-containing protein
VTGLLRRYFSYPALPGEEATLRARTFHRVALGFLVIAVPFLILLGVMEPTAMNRRLVNLSLLALLVLPLVELNRRGHTRLAGALLLIGMVAIVVRGALTSGGMSTAWGFFMIFFVALGGLLFSPRGAVICALLLGAVGLVLVLMAGNGMLPASEVTFTPLSTWFFAMLCMGLSLMVQREVSASVGLSLQRAQAEVEARTLAQDRLQLAIEAGRMGVWILDVEERRTLADPSLFELYAIPLTADHRIDYGIWLSRIHAEDRAQAHAAVQEMISSRGVVRTEFRIVRPDGSMRHVEAIGTAERDRGAGTKAIIGINRDVTEKRHAERERERLVHELGERVKELRLLHAASRLMQHGAISQQQLFERLVAAMPGAWQYPEICQARLTFGDQIVATPGWQSSPWTLGIEFRTSDGSGHIAVAYLEERPAADEGPFLAEERNLLESLAEMLVSHLELRKHREELEALVATRTRQMREARDEAEQANRSKGDFLANMSHEIRTPMNAILGYAQLLRRDAGLTRAHQERLDAILSSGDHLLTLINNVLDMSKIEAGKTTLVVAPFDLPALLRDLEAMFAALMAAKSLELSVVGVAELPRVICADAGRVRQVVINMLSNALKFTRTGRIRLSTSSSAGPDGHCVSITVTDTGPGIPAEDIPRVFEAFEQSESGTRAGGTGLGLPIASELARLMGGDLTVASEPGKGSTFTFSFQAGIADELAAGLTRRVVGIRSEGPAPKVLVVDDQPDNLTIADEMLRGVGFQTQLAMRGAEALDKVTEWHPDLLLMDLRMPGMSGIEVVTRLRAAGNRVPVVAFTASGLEALAEEARAAGADDVLFKPCKEAALLEVLGRQLGLEYVYEEVAPDATEEAGVSTGDTTRLQVLGAGVPRALLEELLVAALQARAARIEQLAGEIAVHAPASADRIRKLAVDFRYEELIISLRAATGAD